MIVGSETTKFSNSLLVSLYGWLKPSISIIRSEEDEEQVSLPSTLEQIFQSPARVEGAAVAKENTKTAVVAKVRFV